MERRGFSLLEILLTIGILGIVTAFTIPLYRSYQARSSLNIATQQALQGFTRAKLLSQNAEKDSSWGFYVPGGVLFKGSSYVDRDKAFDEVYPMLSVISESGSIREVSFSKLDGIPSATGSIVLTALDGAGQPTTATIVIRTEGIAALVGSTLTICHQPGTSQQTMAIVDSAWPSYREHGDTLGACL